ncbi:phosphoglucosamine mutase [Methanomicrobium sp. W14]|nr:phosphoglucosamine mutase [Methanomicrobium sp. W14]
MLSLDVGCVVGSGLGSVITARDTRTTGKILQDAFMSGAVYSGAEVYDGGIAPTPTVAYAAKERDAGCCVTASHNPENYNGLKLINPDGSAFTKKQQEITEEMLSRGVHGDWKKQGVIRTTDIIEPHKEAILRSVQVSGDMEMVVDCGGGAGCMITPILLKDLGVKVHCINCNVSGRFPRPSEPLEKNLSYISNMVKKTGSCGAVIHDGDADRFMAFDEKGRFVGGDKMLILFAEYLDAKKVVTTQDASMAIEEVADVHRTPVGDSFVSEELISWGDFGGEPSGSWVFPNHSLCPDGIYAAALFCKIASENSISSLVDEMPDYPLLRSSYACKDAQGVLLEMGAEIPTDGIRVEGEDGWCLVRASGTEPKVRITAEGKTVSIARQMEEKGLSLLKSAGKRYKQSQ